LVSEVSLLLTAIHGTAADISEDNPAVIGYISKSTGIAFIPLFVFQFVFHKTINVESRENVLHDSHNAEKSFY